MPALADLSSPQLAAMLRTGGPAPFPVSMIREELRCRAGRRSHRRRFTASVLVTAAHFCLFALVAVMLVGIIG